MFFAPYLPAAPVGRQPEGAKLRNRGTAGLVRHLIRQIFYGLTVFCCAGRSAAGVVIYHRSSACRDMDSIMKREQFDRLLVPRTKSVILGTLVRAAKAVGRQLRMELCSAPTGTN
jgi:hypothetical protein